MLKFVTLEIEGLVNKAQYQQGFYCDLPFESSIPDNEAA